MGKTRKYYVVWQGIHPGVYNNWEDCKEQVEGQSGAKYKAFESREAAEEAFLSNCAPVGCLFAIQSSFIDSRRG